MPDSETAIRTGSPRHEQVSTWIREQIDNEVYGVDDQLPSESQLGAQFSVSRITVRRALQTLESEGLIYKRQGLGSFVRGAQVRQGLVRLTDFVEDMSAAGIEARSEVLFIGSEPASPRVARMLDLEVEEQVVRLDRLRFGDNEPIAFDRTWLPVFFGQLIRNSDLTNDTIYGVLERTFDVKVCCGRYRIEAANAPNDIAGYLDIPWGRALLLIERTSGTADDRPVYFQQRYYRCDRVAYELELSRDPSSREGVKMGFPLREFEPVFKK